jgi:hypothetical protein
LEWLEILGNYNQYKSARKKRKNHGSVAVSRKRKSQVIELIFQFLRSHEIFKTTNQIQNKLKYHEQSYRKVVDFLCNIREGLTSIEEKLGINAIRDKVLLLCLLFEHLNPFMSNKACSNPSYLGDSMDHVQVEDIIGYRSIFTSFLRACQTHGDSSDNKLESPLHCSQGTQGGSHVEDGSSIRLPSKNSQIENSPSVQSNQKKKRQKRRNQKDLQRTYCLLVNTQAIWVKRSWLSEGTGRRITSTFSIGSWTCNGKDSPIINRKCNYN